MSQVVEVRSTGELWAVVTGVSVIDGPVDVPGTAMAYHGAIGGIKP